ncbi:MAG: 23S rRNA (adenine(2503)-C(2))-methyltransferase RlmN [Bdellovibrionota bacterium]
MNTLQHQNKPLAISFDETQWINWFMQNGENRFRAKQIFEWFYFKGEFNPQNFSNMSLELRQKLATEFDWSVPTIDTLLTSNDDSEKFLLKLHDGRLAECVLMPSENRVTLCVSCQIGCQMGCTFCQTGKMGLTRNLSVGEILIQITLANKRLNGRKVTNVVFMGMGEPLDNYDAVVGACKNMIDPKLFGLSKHKVTVSTSGLIPEINKLGKDVPVALAISLHTADDAERSKIMPVNKKYPLAELKQALLNYPVQTRHGITFEYVMIEGVNDSIAHAKKLVKFLHGLKAKVNLIPMNPHPGSTMVATDLEQMRKFQLYLTERSIPAPVRYSRGQDVSAACGQLASKRKNELHLPPRTVALERRKEYLSSKRS